jgi:hypothetical protein
MNEKDFEGMKKLVHAAIDAKTIKDLRLNPATDTIEKIMNRDLRDLGVQPSQFDGIWTLINGNIKDDFPNVKRVEEKDRSGVKTAGDIWKKVCAANGVDEVNRPIAVMA